MITTTGPDRWRELGAALIRQRIAINPRYYSRGVFCEATGLKYRLIYDIEEARRTNFGAATLAAVEVAYHLPPGAIGRFLETGQFGPPAAGGPRPRLVPAPDPEQVTALPEEITKYRHLYLPYMPGVVADQAQGRLAGWEHDVQANDILSQQDRWELVCWWRWTQDGQPGAASEASARLTALAGNGEQAAGVLPVPGPREK